MGPLRVLLVAGPAAGGIKRHLEHIARHGRGHRFELVFVGPGRLPGPLTLARLMAGGGRRAGMAGGPDVVHAHGYRAVLMIMAGRWVAGWFRPEVRGPAVVATLHGFPPRGPGGRLCVWALRRVDGVVAVSSALAGWARAAGVDPARLWVIPNGVDRRGKGEAPGQVTGRPGGPRFGALARLSPEKGLDILMRAAGMAREKLAGMSLSIAGEGPERRRLEALARRLGLDGVVRFLGWVDDPVAFLDGVDVLVAPSRSEGQSLAVMEAMAAGRPVVAARVGGLSELVHDGETGLLVTPEDPAALAEAMVRLGLDAGERARMGSRAEALSAAHGDARESVRRVLVVYERVARRGAARTAAKEPAAGRLLRPAWVLVAVGLVLLGLRPLLFASPMGRPALGPVPPGRGVWIVTTDGTALDDWARSGLSAYPEVLKRAAVGLMNTRTAAPLGKEGTLVRPGASAAGYYTLGWGARATGGEGVAVEALVGQNQRLDHAVDVGLVGEALRASGVVTAAVGGTGRLGPSAACAGMVMDRSGSVDFLGDLAALTPALSAWREAGRRYLVAVDSPGGEGQMVAADATLAEVLGLAGGDQVVLVAPSASPSRVARGDELAPMAVLSAPELPGDPTAGPGERARLTLVSPTTRRPGLVANIDLAPTVLAAFGAGATGPIYGRSVRTVADPAGSIGRTEAWGRLQGRLQVERFAVGRSYIAAQVLTWSAALALLWGPAAWRAGRARQAVMTALLGVALYPLVSLAMGAWGATVAVVDAPVGLAGAALAAVFVRRAGRGSTLLSVGLAGALTALAVALDVLAGSPLSSRSALGFSLVSGARYYGLGNEFMGVFVGAGLVGAAFLAEWAGARRGGGPNRAPIAATGLLSVLVAGAPWAGANLGGALAAAAGYAWWAWPSARAGRKGPAGRVLTVAAAVALAGLVTVALDLAGGADSATHVGSLAREAARTGPGVLLPVLTRKLGMNLRLLRYTVWSRILVGSMAAYVVLLFRPRGAVLKAIAGRPLVRRGLVAATVAAAAALAANDSGVVAAGTLMIYPGVGLLSLLLDEGDDGRGRLEDGDG